MSKQQNRTKWKGSPGKRGFERTENRLTHGHFHSYIQNHLVYPRYKGNESDSRQQAFVVRTLIEFPHAIDAPHGTHVAEDDLIGADAYDRSVFCKKGVNGLALLKSEDVGCKPKVGNRRVPDKSGLEWSGTNSGKQKTYQGPGMAARGWKKRRCIARTNA